MAGRTVGVFLGAPAARPEVVAVIVEMGGRRESDPYTDVSINRGNCHVLVSYEDAAADSPDYGVAELSYIARRFGGVRGPRLVVVGDRGEEGEVLMLDVVEHFARHWPVLVDRNIDSDFADGIFSVEQLRARASAGERIFDDMPG